MVAVMNTFAIYDSSSSSRSSRNSSSGATGTLDGSSAYLVGEISYTADEDDVMRAARRTACLKKAGVPAIGLVACEQISPQTSEYALKQGVFVWVDGRVLAPESPPQSPAA